MKRDTLRLQQFLRVLGDTTRLQIVLHLMGGEACVCTIVQRLGLEQTLVSHHLRVLRRVGLIHDRKVGTWVHCSLDATTLKEVEVLFRNALGAEQLSKKGCDARDACRVSCARTR